MFYSGKHWSEPWEGEVSPSASLRDPETLTEIRSGGQPFAFHVKDTKGNDINFSQDKFSGKVSIVQIMGSWCPNCTDESRLLKDLYNKYSSRGLQVIPVGFERSDDFKTSAKALKEQAKELGLPYDVFVGSGKGKAKAEETFPMLEHVLSFPTSIIIDKNGSVRKVITGFYGPGTGEYYYRQAERLELLIQQMLAEEVVR
jgi:peroxiredoxin